MRPADLLARVGEHGFRVDVTPDGPFLVPVLPGAKLPADLLADLKANKAALLKHLTCSGCGRAITCAADRERVADPAFCDRGSCPYKRTARK